jgi:GTP-binding protein HflX
MLSDTVGFISDLPHELVAAFRATLEEVQEADLLSTEQKEDVLTVLRGLLDEQTMSANIIEVWNKIDRLEEGSHLESEGETIRVSALTGAGIDTLLAKLDQTFEDSQLLFDITLPASDGKKAAWLHSHGSVLSQTEKDGELIFKVKLSAQNKARWEKMAGG